MKLMVCVLLIAAVSCIRYDKKRKRTTTADYEGKYFIEGKHGFSKSKYDFTGYDRGVGNDVSLIEVSGNNKNNDYGDHYIPSKQSVTLHKEVEIPVNKYYPVVKKKQINVPVNYPVAFHVDKPYPVYIKKDVPVAVYKPVPYTVIQHVPYHVHVPVKVPVETPVAVHVEKPVPYPVHIPIKVAVPKPFHVYKKVPVFLGSKYGKYKYSGHKYDDEDDNSDDSRTYPAFEPEYTFVNKKHVMDDGGISKSYPLYEPMPSTRKRNRNKKKDKTKSYPLYNIVTFPDSEEEKDDIGEDDEERDDGKDDDRGNKEKDDDDGMYPVFDTESSSINGKQKKREEIKSDFYKPLFSSEEKNEETLEQGKFYPLYNNKPPTPTPATNSKSKKKKKSKKKNKKVNSTSSKPKEEESDKSPDVQKVTTPDETKEESKDKPYPVYEPVSVMTSDRKEMENADDPGGGFQGGRSMEEVGGGHRRMYHRRMY